MAVGTPPRFQCIVNIWIQVGTGCSHF
jgi:hypothetical protein